MTYAARTAPRSPGGSRPSPAPGPTTGPVSGLEALLDFLQFAGHRGEARGLTGFVRRQFGAGRRCLLAEPADPPDGVGLFAGPLLPGGPVAVATDAHQDQPDHDPERVHQQPEP